MPCPIEESASAEKMNSGESEQGLIQYKRSVTEDIKTLNVFENKHENNVSLDGGRPIDTDKVEIPEREETNFRNELMDVLLKDSMEKSQVEVVPCEETYEDYQEMVTRNIEEKRRKLSQFFQDINMDAYKQPVINSPKIKPSNSTPKKPKTLILPRKYLPRRSASKAASERLTLDCFSDEGDDTVVNLSDEEVTESGKKRKVVIAFRPRAKRQHRDISEPRIILSADDISVADLQNVADIVTEKVYSQSGTTCHQCRQKTLDMKTICRSDKCRGVRGYFCGPCLRNRYGEDARAALKDPNWQCPPCRDICNCSICRNRAGIQATGILTPTAKHFGYASVKDYLQDHDKYVIKYEDE